MAEKNVKSRIVHKHDVEANWLLAENFIPKQGELIVYDIDENYNYERIKIGDGTTNVSSLPFINQNITMEDIDIFVQAEEPLDAEEGSIWVDLDEDFEPDETVEIEVDATLTQEGMAADAKAVGDEINRLSGKIENAGSIIIDLNGANEGEINPVNADTLNGKYIDDFALNSDVDQLSLEITQLNSLVGEESVSTQIDSAIEALRQEILGGAW